MRGWSYHGHHFIFASIVPLGIATIWILLSTGSGQRRPWCRNYHRDKNIFCSSSRPHQHVYWPTGLAVNKRTCPQIKLWNNNSIVGSHNKNIGAGEEEHRNEYFVYSKRREYRGALMSWLDFQHLFKLSNRFKKERKSDLDFFSFQPEKYHIRYIFSCANALLFVLWQQDKVIWYRCQNMPASTEQHAMMALPSIPYVLLCWSFKTFEYLLLLQQKVATFLAVQDSSIGDLVTDSLTHSVTFWLSRHYSDTTVTLEWH